MTITHAIATCQCGNPVDIKKTGECKRCYMRRYQSERPHLYAGIGPRFMAKPEPTPCEYLAAHRRVRDYRGPAKAYLCTCGRPAAEWSYRGNSPREMSGLTVHGGRNRRHHLSWSPDVDDYDPMCHRCHAARDGRQYLHGKRLDAALALVAKWADITVTELTERLS